MTKCTYFTFHEVQLWYEVFFIDLDNCSYNTSKQLRQSLSVVMQQPKTIAG